MKVVFKVQTTLGEWWYGTPEEVPESDLKKLHEMMREVLAVRSGGYVSIGTETSDMMYFPRESVVQILVEAQETE